MVEGLGIKTINSDGNSTKAVISSFLKAKDYVKKNSLPIFLEYQTYRWFEHCGPNIDDHLNYRTKKEIEHWKKNDPIKLLQNTLFKKKWINQNSLNSLKDKIKKRINEAFDYAKKSPFPKEKDLNRYLYK